MGRLKFRLGIALGRIIYFSTKIQYDDILSIFFTFSQISYRYSYKEYSFEKKSVYFFYLSLQDPPLSTFTTSILTYRRKKDWKHFWTRTFWWNWSWARCTKTKTRRLSRRIVLLLRPKISMIWEDIFLLKTSKNIQFLFYIDGYLHVALLSLVNSS